MIRLGLLCALACVLGFPRFVVAAPVDDNIQLLRSRPTGMEEDEWRKQRREVARELGEIRSSAAVDALIGVVETERYDAVLSIAIESLGKQGDVRAIPPLQRIYADRSIDTFIREQAGKSIEALGGTPRDDARLVGGAAALAPGGGVAVEAGAPALEGPQLGTMGEASVAEDQFVDSGTFRPLPSNLRARSRNFAFVLGDLDLSANVPLRKIPGQQLATPVVANAGLAVVADYVDERERWGWTASGRLDGVVVNGDLTTTPTAEGDNDGGVLYVRQSLVGQGEVHAYFGRTDFHAFGDVAISQRVNHARVEDLEGGGDEADLSDTRFAIDIIPAGGFGWGRYLNAGSELAVDAIIAALERENILAKPLDEAAKHAIYDALYRYANPWSAYPRVASTLQILTDRGFLARRPGPRLLYRIRSIVEDPSYWERHRGIRARVGFLYDAVLAQSDYFRRNGDSIGAPFVQVDAGFQLDLEREILAAGRFWFDAIGQRGFTSDASVLYRRYFHNDVQDYRGEWFGGVRGGVSQREFPDLVDANGDPADVALGYRALVTAGYSYGFSRGSRVSVNGDIGIDSGRLLVGAALALRFGIVQSSVLRARHVGAAPTRSTPTRAASSGAGNRSKAR